MRIDKEQFLKSYYGRDLRGLTDEQLRCALLLFENHDKKSRISRLAWQNLQSEKARRKGEQARIVSKGGE